jgi:hypothetical protein
MVIIAGVFVYLLYDGIFSSWVLIAGEIEK